MINGYGGLMRAGNWHPIEDEWHEGSDYCLTEFTE